jgi:hypothetical protein
MVCGLIVGLAHWRIDRHRADGGNLVFSSSARTDERTANQNVILAGLIDKLLIGVVLPLLFAFAKPSFYLIRLFLQLSA